jgi:hypothetical protein
VAATTLVGVIAAFPQAADAHGRGGFHHGIVGGNFFGDPFFGWGYYGWPYYGFGPYSGPYWSPYYGAYGPNSFDMGLAAAAGIGAVDLNVKPNQAEVWVDGKFVAEARDLDGSPSFLWLREGPHHLVIYKGGYRSLEEDIAVQPGQKMDVKVRLEKGDSQPPGRRPSAKANSAD